MNRKFIFIAVAAVLMLGMLYLNSAFLSATEPTEKAVVVRKVNTVQLVRNVEKSMPIKSSDYAVISMNEDEALANGIELGVDSEIRSGSLYRNNIEAGAFMRSDDIANAEDQDYIFLSLNKDEVPYFYEITNPGIIDAVPIEAGDKVSFVATTSSEENIKEQGYSELDSIVSKIIINNAKVIKVNETVSTDDDDVEASMNILVALKVDEVLKLEMAQKIAEVTLVPSKLSQRFISIKSSDIVQGIHGVRELRAGTNCND